MCSEGAYGTNERVLVLLRKSRDARSMPRVLERVGLVAVMCATPEELCEEIAKGAETLLVEEETLTVRTYQCLMGILESQPQWSELPIIVLLRRGSESGAARHALLLPADVTLVERPVRVNTLVALVRSALRSRRRQYLVRDQLHALKEITDSLRQAETNYRTLFDSMDEGYCVIEMRIEPDEPLDYRFIEMNPAFEKQSTLVDAKGKWMRELRPEHEESWFEIYRDVALTGNPIRFEHGGKALQDRWFTLYALRVGKPEQRRVGVLFYDITARKRAEEELRKTKDELEIRVRERTAELSRTLENLRTETDERIQAVEELRRKDQLLIQQSRLAAMGEMLVNISHQWRQPLNVLGLILQELNRNYQRGTFSQEYLTDSVAKARKLIEHMSQTIDDFRNFLKPDKVRVNFHVGEVVETTFAMLRESLKEMQINLQVLAEEAVFIEGYRNEFAQVVMNILVNARDAFRERGVVKPRITVKIFREEGKAVVTIADNAGGIAGEALDRIFEPYFTTKAPDRGTGIGLFMSKTIIETNMSGSLTVRNTPEGAEFRIEV